MILITGANGFIGSQIAHALRAESQTPLVCVDIVSPEERPQPLKGLTHVKYIDRFELFAFLKSSAAREITHVVHMGANSSTTETRWDVLQEYNIFDSQKLAQWCAREGVPFVYASSAATYGDGQKGFDDSTHPSELTPLNLYGKSKNEFDRWMLAQSETPPSWYGLKFFNVYGPHEDHKGSQASVAYHAFNQIKKTQQLKLFRSHREDFKDGEQKRDFIYVKDVANSILKLMDHDGNSGIYNLGSGKAQTWNELGEAMFSAIKKKKKVEFIDIPENIRGQYQYTTEAKMQKWFNIGLPKPEFSLKEGVRDYVETYLNHKA
jgi:ADP-L-glycero-D-manno-heptose 6-epimerase